jgi:hypothetical protein
MPVQSAEPENARVLLFTTAAQAGSSLLRQAAGIPDAFRSAEILAQSWRQALKAQSDDKKRYDPALSRQLLDMNLSAAMLAHPAHAAVLNVIRQDLTRPFDVQHDIEQIAKRACQSARRFISVAGGPHARTRLAHIKRLPVSLPVGFLDGPTVPIFDRSSKARIDVQVNLVEDAVWDYLNLEIGFFHEHISHQLPSWSEDQFGFSEGYLLAAEFEWLKSDGDSFEYRLIERVQSNVRAADVAQEYGRRAQWFMRRCKDFPGCFSRFLLEWAAQWKEIKPALHKRLDGLLSGVFNKSSLRPGKARTLLTVREDFEKIFCPGCRTGFEIKRIVRQLTTSMRRFNPPPGKP